MKTEIIFLYNNHRCHAEVVEKLSVEKTWKTFVGRVDGYEIYRTCGVHLINLVLKQLRNRRMQI